MTGANTAAAANEAVGMTAEPAAKVGWWRKFMETPPRGTLARGLYNIDQAGGPAGKTEVDFVNAIGRKPVSISEMAAGHRLLQWRFGTRDIQSIAVLFDAQHRFVKITHRYQI